MIISHLTARPDVWCRMVSPPVLVSKCYVMLGYNPIYESTASPAVKKIVDAVRRVMTAGGHPTVGVGLTRGVEAASRRDLERPKEIERSRDKPVATADGTARADVIVKVPVMGEGIRAARIVSLLKQ